MDLPASAKHEASVDPFFSLSDPPSLSSRKDARDQAGFSFSADDMLPSFEFEPVRRSGSTNAGPNSSPLHDHTTNDSSSRRHRSAGVGSPVYLTGELFSSKKETDIESYNSVIVSAVERTIKKYADNILRVLEGMSGRLSQLESITQELEHSVESLKTSVDEYHSEDDLRIRALNNHVMEMHRAVQILRDKQDIIETHAELAKLRTSKLEATSEKSNVPSPISNASNLQTSEHQQQLALAVVPTAVAPPSQLLLASSNQTEVMSGNETTMHSQQLSLARPVNTMQGHAQLHAQQVQQLAQQVPQQVQHQVQQVPQQVQQQLQVQQAQQQLQVQQAIQQAQQQVQQAQQQVQQAPQLVQQQRQVQQVAQVQLLPQSEMLQGQLQVSQSLQSHLQMHQGGQQPQTQGFQPPPQLELPIQQQQQQQQQQQPMQAIQQPVPQFQQQVSSQHFQQQGPFQLQHQTPGSQSLQGSQVQQVSTSRLQVQHSPTPGAQVPPHAQPQAIPTSAQLAHPQPQAMPTSAQLQLPALPPVNQGAFPQFVHQNEYPPGAHGQTTFQGGYLAGPAAAQQQFLPPTQLAHQMDSSYQRNTMPLQGLQSPHGPGTSVPISWKEQNPQGVRTLPVAQPVHSEPPTSMGHLPPGRSPVDVLIEKVAAMGFPRDQVGAVIRRLTERGQAVDMNTVIDSLMNRDNQPQRGWQGR